MLLSICVQNQVCDVSRAWYNPFPMPPEDIGVSHQSAADARNAQRARAAVERCNCHALSLSVILCYTENNSGIVSSCIKGNAMADVFISYLRTEKEFVSKRYAGLVKKEHKPW
jgi:hypothetical protein